MEIMAARSVRTMSWLACGVATVLLAAACATKAPPVSSKFVAPDGSVEMAHLQVKMRDGIRLDTTVYLPDASGGPFPVVLVRTPYKTEMRAFDGRLLSEGYAIVEQHERGRYLSEGQSRMLSYAPQDGWDTLDWIAKQSWSDGKVATMGCSSSAENQLKLGTLGHPAHKAMIAYSAGVGVAEAGPFREQGNFWRGGVWQQGWTDYFLSETAQDWPQLPEGLSDAERQRASAWFSADNGAPQGAAKALEDARMHLPMTAISEAAGAPRNELGSYLARGPVNAAWDDDRVTNADTIKVPGLWAEALYDISARSTVAFFDQARAANPAGTQSIMIVNGRHCAYGREKAAQTVGDRPIGDARFDYDARAIAFLDHWLKGKTDTALPAHPVRTYMAGANRWADFDAIPWAGRDRSQTFYLSGGGKANTLSGDGVLATETPRAVAVDVFSYDPANPVISHGGEISGVGEDQVDGSFDQRQIEARPDVLVYTSAALAADLAVFGYIETELFVGSNAPDTDFTVKLVDVAPDGTAWNIADTIQRMRYHDGDDKELFMTPGDNYRVAPPAMLASNVFLKGHRIRVEVSSSNFPSYARNLNTAADPYATTEFRVAENRVLHGPEQLSKIILPIVDVPK
jgi:uncharacterized protein